MFLFFSGTMLNVIQSNFESYLECSSLFGPVIIYLYAKFIDEKDDKFLI